MTDTIIQNIKFDERGLIAAIVQEAGTNAVLSLCYLDNPGLARTLQTGQAPPLGDATQKTHRLVDIRLNQDGGFLTIIVEQGAAPAMRKPISLLRDIEESQKGNNSAVSLVDPGSMEFGIALDNLYRLIGDRKEKRPEGSYTTYLFNSGLDKILKKIAEESGEVIIAAKNESRRQVVAELADLFYHLLVLMVEREVKLSDVQGELSNRAAQAPKQEKKKG
ncbi:MAG TPA: phosphoribosyl-ATP diphosphatase [Blastocatellia bacterium]|jgi:phosphoribosyl-ATP pyrophosphohydrolase/phosphoribosyl-AMP cyclohydrolase